jgi:fatty acid desaturase
MHTLVPPRKPPPGGAKGGFSWRRGLIGAAVGALIGLAAHFLEWSPWWWLAVAAGFLLASSSFQFQFAIKWGGK